MKIKVELLKGFIADVVANQVEDFEIDPTRIADTKAIMMLSEIQAILQNNELSEFDALEEIGKIFAENRVDSGSWYN